MCVTSVAHTFLILGGGKMCKYVYNKDTGKLHIKGYCQYTKYSLTHYEEFYTEAEALAFDGRAVGLCKVCERKREIETSK